MFKVLFAKQKKLPWKPKRDRGAKPCLSRFPRELRVRCFARDARPYSTERLAPIPDSNPASRTGRVLSHLSIQLLLYGVNTNFATLIIPLPLLRAYFRSFMGGNQFKKVRSRPLKSRRGKRRYAKDCGVCSSFVPVCSKKVGTRFFPVYLRFCSFVPIVPVSNKFYIYTYIYRPLPIFLSLTRKLKIIGTNGTFTRNAW